MTVVILVVMVCSRIQPPPVTVGPTTVISWLAKLLSNRLSALDDVQSPLAPTQSAAGTPVILLLVVAA